MSLNYNYLHDLSCISRSGNNQYNARANNNISTPLFNKQYILDVSNKREINVPLFCRGLIESSTNTKFNTITTIILPIYMTDLSTKILTVDAIFRKLFANNFSQRFTKVSTKKGEIYYVNSGIILDKDFSPIIICSLLGSTENSAYLSYNRMIMHISSKVFIDAEDSVSKGLIKKIIPFYLDNKINVNNTLLESKVIIEDIQGYTQTTVKPLELDNINDVLNQVLIDNMSTLDQFIGNDN